MAQIMQTATSAAAGPSVQYGTHLCMVCDAVESHASPGDAHDVEPAGGGTDVIMGLRLHTSQEVQQRA